MMTGITKHDTHAAVLGGGGGEGAADEVMRAAAPSARSLEDGLLPVMDLGPEAA